MSDDVEIWGGEWAIKPGVQVEYGFAAPEGEMPRAFRFRVQAKSHPRINYLVKRVTLDYHIREIAMELYEAASLPGHEYILYLLDPENKDHEVELVAFDAAGKIYYTLLFKGLSVCHHSIGYDYAVSDLLVHKLKVTYDEMKTINNIH